MPCVRDNLIQPVCLTLAYNISTGVLIESFIECVDEENLCTLGANFNFVSKNLTLTVPTMAEGILTINDHFQSSCVTKDIFLPES